MDPKNKTVLLTQNNYPITITIFQIDKLRTPETVICTEMEVNF